MNVSFTITLVGVCRVVTCIAGLLVSVGALALANDDVPPIAAAMLLGLGAFMVWAGVMA